MLEFDPEETWLLGVLLDIYEPLVKGEEPPEAPRAPDPDDPAGLGGVSRTGPSGDPFEFWEEDMSQEPPGDLGQDPALLRLFPDAYPDDPAASEEFRRYTAAGQRRRRLDDSLEVRVDLDILANGPLQMRPPRVECWLKTLNALRLVLASRLGVVDEASAEEAERLAADDPADISHSAYEWLGVLIEMLVEVSWGEG